MLSLASTNMHELLFLLIHYRVNYISQGGSGIGARADVARKTKEAEHMLANLEKEGVKIDDRIASIIDDEVARIKVEAAR